MSLLIPHRRQIFLPTLTLAALSLLSTQALATPRTIYTGPLQGAGTIVLELDAPPTPSSSPLTGRYFYPAHGTDIPLTGTAASLTEPSPSPNTSTPAATWQGTLTPTSYKGTWTDAKTGKQRHFDLKRVAQYDTAQLEQDRKQARATQVNLGDVDLNAGITSTRAPYDTLKLAGHAKPVGKEIGNATVAYQMWQDPRTKFPYPRLTRHPDPQVMQRINYLLEQRHWQKSLGALDCKATAYTSTNPMAGTLGGFDEEDVKVTWLSRALMTVTESGSLDCGGAHPYNHFDAYTFDLLRGEYLDWNRVFDAYVPGKRTFGGEKSAALLTLVKQAVDQGPDASKADQHPNLEDCADLWPEYLALGAQAPGALSLSVSGVGHASGACLGTHAQVPFKALTPYLKPGGEAYLVRD
ncbi:hypothetical protein [Achromobacter sp. AONIH1]|uniref:hypothetical protein n=1 Tax=Achromobacter sp. AONIH1 TaxID=1758194 RepID=UPI000CD1727C|nr:hypothetical protein [Achromobacter sp. AONIH1]AUT46645.1 hypothetical protein C2U31_12015 [Achromobacter sp. AONIH1]